MWDLLLVAMSKLVVLLSKPVLDWRERTRPARQRRLVAAMATLPIDAVRAGGPRVKIAGTVEAAPRATRALAFFVRDDAGGHALVHAGAVTAMWCERDPGADWQPAPGDRVVIVGEPRAADAAVDRELGADAPRVRVVFAGGEARPLFVARVA